MSQITSFRTREVRWFLNRPIPKVGQWFETLPPTSYTRESREDVYLVLTGRKDLGIKFRENRLELKYRIGPSRRQEIAPGIRGSMEAWEKLGFPSTPEIASSILPEGSTAMRVPVLKERMATIIETNSARTTFQPLGIPVEAGVQFEYTQLQILGSKWYTLGLEWTGDKGIVLPAELLSALPPAALVEETASMGYPEFLQRLIHPEDEC
jgi:hypothetical protein